MAHLNDAHDSYNLPSTFRASLGLSVDIYDGKVLIDSINRTLLPASKFPFQIGDELITVDDKNVQDLIQQFSKYIIFANPRSTARGAASLITSRPQSDYAKKRRTWEPGLARCKSAGPGSHSSS